MVKVSVVAETKAVEKMEKVVEMVVETKAAEKMEMVTREEVMVVNSEVECPAREEEREEKVENSYQTQTRVPCL